MGDIKVQDALHDDVINLLRDVFGPSFCEARANEHFRGVDQVNSMMSSWDACQHMIDQGHYLNNCQGVTLS